MENKTALTELDQNWLEIAPQLLDYQETARTMEDRNNVSMAVRSKYIGSMPINNDTVPQLVQIEGDRHFVAGIDHFAKTLAAVRGSKPVYMYQYGYKAEYSVSMAWSNSTVNRGKLFMIDQFYNMMDGLSTSSPRKRFFPSVVYCTTNVAPEEKLKGHRERSDPSSAAKLSHMSK